MNQCAALMSVAGVNDHACRFIDDDEELIFKKDIQRNRFRDKFKRLVIRHLNAISLTLNDLDRRLERQVRATD